MSEGKEVTAQCPGYSLSSWNYGAFHQSNANFLPKECLKKTSEERSSRPKSVNLNKNGKRDLKEDEKIGKINNIKFYSY
jgi:hypothetical protein